MGSFNNEMRSELLSQNIVIIDVKTGELKYKLCKSYV